MKLTTFLALLFMVSVASADDSGFLVWADASEEAADTGDKVCALADQPPQYFLPDHECLKVFVPGSATEIACDVDMTGAGTASNYYVVLCH